LGDIAPFSTSGWRRRIGTIVVVGAVLALGVAGVASAAQDHFDITGTIYVGVGNVPEDDEALNKQHRDGTLRDRNSGEDDDEKKNR